MLADWQPTADQLADELAAMRGGWTSHFAWRTHEAFMMETFVLMFWGIWRAGGLMLMGMALFKLGFFSAKKPLKAYAAVVAIGLSIGLPIVMYGVHQNEARQWNYDYSFFLGSQFNYWGSVFVAIAYTSIIMLLCQWKNSLAWLKQSLAATGRMALTNYLAQSVICTTIYYGHGLGWYAHHSRPQLLLVVFSVWVVQLIASPIWLNRYRYGPLEWLWRSLSYWRMQPMAR